MHDFAEINARFFHLKVRLLLRRCVYFFKLPFLTVSIQSKYRDEKGRKKAIANYSPQWPQKTMPLFSANYFSFFVTAGRRKNLSSSISFRRDILRGRASPVACPAVKNIDTLAGHVCASPEVSSSISFRRDILRGCASPMACLAVEKIWPLFQAAKFFEGWWRRGELNPGPGETARCFLHA